MKSFLLKLPVVGDFFRNLNNQTVRDVFVKQQLEALSEGTLLLDAGCGSQRYRQLCGRLQYRSQDFGQYTVDDKKAIGSDGMGGDTGYQYGPIDYVSNIWEIPEKDQTFDAILCTEVFEHIPYPIAAVTEFARLLKPGGVLILTAPANCLRHMDPYYFYAGFSDRWYQKVLHDNGLEIKVLEPVGDYYSWLAVEIARTAAAHSIVSKLLLIPAFLYFAFKKKTPLSTNTLCEGYHVVARRVA